MNPYPDAQLAKFPFEYLHHKGCDAPVTKDFLVDHMWCTKCRTDWKFDLVRRSGQQWIADRFYVRSGLSPSAPTEVIVWGTDPLTNVRHTKSVPVSESEGLERVVF